jgi:uroporphyrinogen-III synthase
LPDADAVLITRPQAQAELTAMRVAVLGLRPVIAPMLEVHPLAAQLPEDAGAVVLTSGNTVAALPRWARMRPIFAVGDATATRTRTAGFLTVFSADGDATALASLVAMHDPPNPLLLLTGQGQGDTLVQALLDQGRIVIRRAVYEAAPAGSLPDAARGVLREGRVRAALFFSAETARTFVRLVQAAGLGESTRTATACAISEATAMALQPLPWRRIRYAARPTQDDTLALLR